MIMNADDKRRYEWLRQQFVDSWGPSDGDKHGYISWRHRLTDDTLPRGDHTLDEAIDLAMGVTPTGEKLEEMVPLSLCVQLLIVNTTDSVFVGGKRHYADPKTATLLSTNVESAVRELARGN